MATEIELKLLIDPADVPKLRRMPELKTWSKTKPVSRKLVTTYYDTPDLALWRAGIALRVRRVGRLWIQTIKGGGTVHAGLHQRTEWESEIARPTPNLDKITDQPLLKLFSRHDLRERLLPVFITGFRRTSWMLSFEEGDEIELSLDQGEVRTGQSVTPLCEVELELKAGQSKKLYEVALQLLEAVPLIPENTSKAERGYALYSGVSAFPVKAATPGLTLLMSANVAFKAIVESCIVHLQANRMLLGQGPEYLHQMRIALRRLRSAQNLFGSKTPGGNHPEISDSLIWFAEQLGNARDWDVFVTETLPPLLARFSGHRELASILRHGLKHQQHYNEIARAAVNSRRYAKLLLDLGMWLDREGWSEYLTRAQQQELAAPAGELARKILDRQHKQLLKRGSHYTQLTLSELHAVRIAAKKLRYAAAFFAELYAHDQSYPYLKALANLQDKLGALNDTATTNHLLASLHTSRPSAAYTEAIGIVLGWEACKGAQCLADLGQTWNVFRQQQPFWTK